MKNSKSSTIAIRLDPKLKTLLNKKTKRENGYDVSGIIRYLINLYVTDQIVLPKQNDFFNLEN